MRVRDGTPGPSPGERVRWKVIVNGVHEDFELENEGTVLYVLSSQYVVETDDHITHIVHRRDIKP